MMGDVDFQLLSVVTPCFRVDIPTMCAKSMYAFAVIVLDCFFGIIVDYLLQIGLFGFGEMIGVERVFTYAEGYYTVGFEYVEVEIILIIVGFRIGFVHVGADYLDGYLDVASLQKVFVLKRHYLANFVIYFLANTFCNLFLMLVILRRTVEIVVVESEIQFHKVIFVGAKIRIYNKEYRRPTNSIYITDHLMTVPLFRTAIRRLLYCKFSYSPSFLAGLSLKSPFFHD